MNEAAPARARRGGTLVRIACAALCVAPSIARAEDPPPASPPVTPAPDSPADLAARVRRLEELNERLARELAQLRADHDDVEARANALGAKLSGRITGYADFGFFYAQGDGSGIRSLAQIDDGRRLFPGYPTVPDSWVFVGDPLSTAINSRGEPADTGESRAITFNPVNNGGKASFILNELHVGLFAGVGERLTFNAALGFVPRSRDVSDPGGLFLGDFLEVKLAYLEYRLPVEALDLRVTAGKMDSVVGIEYRVQSSSARMGVTPSLICRYTCGRPLGVKLRGRLPGDRFTFALAVTNGSHMSEGFPFANEIDTNNFKTVAGRLSTTFPVGAGLEIGASAAFGAQDFQAADDVFQWHAGADLRLEVRGLDVRAEFVIGRADGRDEPGAGARTCGLAPCLEYKGAYGQVAYRLLNWLTPYVRVDWRDAFHRSGDSFVYISQLYRVTAGLHLELGESVIVKAEYVLNREYGAAPQFADDVVTSSLVVAF